MAGLPPRCHLTFRELVIYARERMDESWWHTAQLAAGVVNMFSKRKIEAREFHPFYATRSTKRTDGLTMKEFKKALHEGNWRF